MYKTIYLLLSNLFVSYCFHLNNYQINLINSLIKSNKLSHIQRNKINNIIYISYEKWAIKKAVEFKKFHKYKCQDISTSELILSSKIGLFKSIKKYNGNYSFINFSEFYVKGELLRTLTNSFSFSSVDKKIRIQSKKNTSHEELINYKKYLKPHMISYDKNWKFDKLIKIKNQDAILNDFLEREDGTQKCVSMWNKIDDLNPFCKKIFYLKYDREFNKIRSNKNISILMCCSTENIRINFKKSLHFLLQQKL